MAESDKRVAERELEVGTLSRGKYSLYLATKPWLAKANLLCTNQVAKPALGTQLLCSASRYVYHTRSRLAARSTSQPLGFGLSAGEARLAAAAHYKLPAAMILVASPRPRASARVPPADTGRGRGPCSIAAEERGYPPRPPPGLERYPGRNRLDAAGHHEKPTTAPV